MASESSSPYHKLATTSIVAIPLGLAVGIASNVASSIVEPPFARITGLIISILIASIILIGLFSGVAALFGIRRYGKKGILIKSIIGILIPLLMIISTIPLILNTRQLKQASIYHELLLIAKQADEKCPIMIDKATRLDKVEVAGASTIIYNYTLPTLNKSEVAEGSIENALQPVLTEKYKNSLDMEFLRRNSMTIIYRYKDKLGAQIAEISAGPRDISIK